MVYMLKENILNIFVMKAGVVSHMYGAKIPHLSILLNSVITPIEQKIPATGTTPKASVCARRWGERNCKKVETELFTSYKNGA